MTVFGVEHVLGKHRPQIDALPQDTGLTEGNVRAPEHETTDSQYGYDDDEEDHLDVVQYVGNVEEGQYEQYEATDDPSGLNGLQLGVVCLRQFGAIGIAQYEKSGNGGNLRTHTKKRKRGLILTLP